MPNGETDISYDERYMWYYNEDDEYTVPSDPRDEEGYDAWAEFWAGGKYKSPAFCEKQKTWIMEYDNEGNLVGCQPPRGLDIWWILIFGYVGYRIIS